ncbi:O-antigen ligase family protein, partial [bacterium]|nr:O-antigen ligase family protein [bacterium]
NKYEIDKLFKIYLRIALIVAVIGIFQEISYVVGFESGYDYSYIIQKWGATATTGGGLLRVNSIFMEPSHFAISMAPAFFVSLLSISRKDSPYLNTKVGRVGSIIVIISYILTFSAVAYVAILISLALIFFNIRNLRYLLLLLVVIPVFIYAAYVYMPEIRMRVDDTIGVATGSIKAADSHLSVYSLASNAFVAYKSFIDNPLLGHGLGSHPISYDEFIRSGASGGFWQEDYPVVNKKDAGSLFLRLASETGLFGIIVVLYFVFKFRLKTSNNKNLQIISNAIFTIFMIQLLKQGHYFYNGFFFFVWLYYFAYKIDNKLKISEPENY